MAKSLKSCLIALALLAVSPAHAAKLDAEGAQKLGKSGLPIPRFASLGASQVHMRSGPDQSYPVSWTYTRPELPVEIIQEYGPWRRVRDLDGTEGWMNGNLLTDRRNGVVLGGIRSLYAAPRPDSPRVWRVEPGVVGRLIVCEDSWCQFSVDGKTGWIVRDQIWGVYPGENFN